MKFAKWLAVLILIYIGIVVACESLLGVVQPAGPDTIVITIQDEDGTPKERVVSRLVYDDQLYVAANHWPRAWYKHALANPSVQVDVDGIETDYTAVPVSGEERERVNDANPLGFIRVLTGFPPREFLRLDPH